MDRLPKYKINEDWSHLVMLLACFEGGLLLKMHRM